MRTPGFTLVEMLVVLVIIGLVTGAAVLTLPTHGGSLRTDALKLAARAKLAAEDSIFSGTPTGLGVTGAGYAFYRMREGRWEEIEGEPAFMPVIWRAGVVATVSRDDGARHVPSDRAVPAPGVVFDPTGLATRFTVGLAEGADRYVIAGTATGKIAVEVSHRE